MPGLYQDLAADAAFMARKRPLHQTRLAQDS